MHLTEILCMTFLHVVVPAIGMVNVNLSFMSTMASLQQVMLRVEIQIYSNLRRQQCFPTCLMGCQIVGSCLHLLATTRLQGNTIASVNLLQGVRDSR